MKPYEHAENIQNDFLEKNEKGPYEQSLLKNLVINNENKIVDMGVKATDGNNLEFSYNYRDLKDFEMIKEKDKTTRGSNVQ